MRTILFVCFSGKISFCCVKEFAYNAYVATAANVGQAIEYCKTQIEIMTK